MGCQFMERGRWYERDVMPEYPPDHASEWRTACPKCVIHGSYTSIGALLFVTYDVCEVYIQQRAVVIGVAVIQHQDK